jgi:hypothetical protein
MEKNYYVYTWDGSRSDSQIRTEPGFAGFATDSRGLLEIRISPPEADFFKTEALDVHSIALYIHRIHPS